MAKKENNGSGLVDIGILVLRLGIGVMFMLHGWPKIAGGAQGWAGLGQAVSVVGINFGFVFWGFMAACAEFFGGLALVVGIGMRFFCVLMAATMMVATAKHLSSGEGLMVASHAIEMGIVFLSLILIGPGGLSLDKFTKPANNKKKEK